MKKAAFLITVSLFSLTAFAQKKTDTTVVKTAYVKLDGQTYNAQKLSNALTHSNVYGTDQYWATLYDFIMTAKNPNYSAADENQLMQPFMPYVQRYQQEQQQKQQQPQPAKK